MSGSRVRKWAKFSSSSSSSSSHFPPRSSKPLTADFWLHTSEGGEAGPRQRQTRRKRWQPPRAPVSTKLPFMRPGPERAACRRPALCGPLRICNFLRQNHLSGVFCLFFNVLYESLQMSASLASWINRPPLLDPHAPTLKRGGRTPG